MEIVPADGTDCRNTTATTIAVEGEGSMYDMYGTVKDGKQAEKVMVASVFYYQVDQRDPTTAEFKAFLPLVARYRPLSEVLVLPHPPANPVAWNEADYPKASVKIKQSCYPTKSLAQPPTLLRLAGWYANQSDRERGREADFPSGTNGFLDIDVTDILYYGRFVFQLHLSKLEPKDFKVFHENHYATCADFSEFEYILTVLKLIFELSQDSCRAYRLLKTLFGYLEAVQPSDAGIVGRAPGPVLAKHGIAQRPVVIATAPDIMAMPIATYALQVILHYSAFLIHLLGKRHLHVTPTDIFS